MDHGKDVDMTKPKLMQRKGDVLRLLVRLAAGFCFPDCMETKRRIGVEPQAFNGIFIRKRRQGDRSAETGMTDAGKGDMVLPSLPHRFDGAVAWVNGNEEERLRRSGMPGHDCGNDRQIVDRLRAIRFERRR